MTRSIVRYGFAFALTLGFVLFAAGKQNLTSGPPPEIRRHIDALLGALNSGDSGGWEKMAQEQFSPDELKRHSAAERKQVFDSLRRDFGTISLGRVEGPDEPLRLHITGSRGASGIIELNLEQTAPYRIDHIGVRMGEDDGNEPPSRLDPPGVNGAMATDELTSMLDTYFSKLVSNDLFSGNVLLAKNGKAVYERSFGLANRADKLPNVAATRFNLGSINKTFTKTAIQQLIARGSLSLNDTVGKLLPDYPQEATGAATVEQLLGHTAGVADFFGEEFTATAKDRFRSNADYYKFVSNVKPLFVPGARKQYCNGCYIVLGAIIERVSGKPYEQYVKDNIFNPAGMTTAGPLQSDGIIPNVAIGYTQHNGNQQLQSNILMHGASGSAAGGGYATIADLLAYTDALRHGRIPDLPPSEGLGVAGGAPGINSIVEEKGQWTVIVLSNLDPPIGEEIGRSLSEALSH
jgi:D-alanyl-D-alanine carboxypeptidase